MTRKHGTLDAENSEWTLEDFRNAKRGSEVFQSMTASIGASQPIDLANWPPDPPPPAPTREAFWTIVRAAGVKVSARRFVRGEWGFEAQILHDGALFIGHRFDTRQQAECWAEAQRKAIEAGR
jgi:hypothetical protein